MKKKIAIVIIVTFVLISNYTLLPVLLGWEPLIHVYEYETKEGQLIKEYPEKGIHVDYNQPGLKRKFPKNYLKFWKWREYLTHDRWNVEPDT